MAFYCLKWFCICFSDKLAGILLNVVFCYTDMNVVSEVHDLILKLQEPPCSLRAGAAMSLLRDWLLWHSSLCLNLAALLNDWSSSVFISDEVTSFRATRLLSFLKLQLSKGASFSDAHTWMWALGDFHRPLSQSYLHSCTMLFCFSFSCSSTTLTAFQPGFFTSLPLTTSSSVKSLNFKTFQVDC